MQPKHDTRRGAHLGRMRMAIAVVALLPVIAPALVRATVQEQRARLPPPAHCEDPVAGVWKSHKYDPRFSDWYIFTLNIERDPKSPEGKNYLTGTINSHSWTGSPKDEEPPPCRPGMRHWTVHMDAQGSVSEDGEIRFWGTSWRPEHTFCGMPIMRGEYNLDHFSGKIDPKIMEFQSVNNDGGRSINDPTVFRRVSCGESQGPADHVNPIAPPFQPPKVDGCSCSAF